jgi:hypothetical protein
MVVVSCRKFKRIFVREKNEFGDGDSNMMIKSTIAAMLSVMPTYQVQLDFRT